VRQAERRTAREEAAVPQHTTHETCPGCGGPATVTWLGIQAYGHRLPVREVAISLDCLRGCDFPTAELTEHFPPKVRRPDPVLG
jgi:hypothetical protein